MVSRRTGHGRIHGRDQTERMHFPYASGRGDAIRRSDRVDKGNTDSDENTWGYMPIHIETVGDLSGCPDLRSAQKICGNAHEIEYVVRAEKLHGGRNYGALKFVTPYEHSLMKLRYCRIRSMTKITGCRNFYWLRSSKNM